MFVNYDAEVWFLLKAIWCAVPKIAFPQLCEIVAEATGKPTPSPDSVRKKCKAEKWAKSIRDYCQKSDKTLDNIKCRLLEDLRKEYEKFQEDGIENSDFVKTESGNTLPISGIPVFPNDLLKNVAYKNRKTVDVLQEHRRRAGKIGQLVDDSMDWMYQAKEAVLANEQDPEQLEIARKQFSLLESMVEKIESFSRTSKNLMQMDFLLFGINTDDTRDSDTSKRLNQIQDDNVFDGARKDLEEQYAFVQKKVEWIQGGDFENEVMQEMEAQMQLDEAEDEKYTDDDDDAETAY